MARTQSRVVGSGFTTLNYRGQPIAWLDQFRDSGQAPLADIGGAGNQAIYAIGDRHAREIVTGRVLAVGTITAMIRELWRMPVWWHLVGLQGTNSIVDVWERLAADPSVITAQMIIRPPGTNGWRSKTFHGCVVTGIDDGDAVTVAGLSVTKQIVISYTHATRDLQGL